MSTKHKPSTKRQHPTPPPYKPECERMMRSMVELAMKQPGATAALHGDPEEIFSQWYTGFTLYLFGFNNSSTVANGLAAYAITRFIEEHPELVQRAGEMEVVA